MENWTIGKRLALSFILVLTITLAIGIEGYFATKTLAGDIEEIGVVRLPSVQTLLQIYQAQTEVDSAENALMSKGVLADKEIRDAQFVRFNNAKERADTAWKIYAPLPQTVEEAATWTEFVPAWEKWWADHLDYEKLVKKQIAEPSEENEKAMVYQAMVTNGVSFGKVETLLKKLVQINVDVGAEETKSGMEHATSTKTTIIIADIQAGYLINPTNNMKLFGSLIYRNFDPMQTTATDFKESTSWFSIGVRADLFNFYFDY